MDEISRRRGKPNAFVIFGAEKSSISSFRMMPVLCDTNWDPNLKQKITFSAIYIYIATGL